MKPLIKIAITGDEIRADEHLRIKTILDAGWDAMHIRVPGASLKDIRNLIESLPQKYHQRLWLHGHFELINEFNLGGLHLNSRCPVPPSNYNGPLSRTCHTIEEALDFGQDSRYSRITLSPIFDSVSKPDYHGRFSDYELMEISDMIVPVIALGGITPERIPELEKLPFKGYAVLGYLHKAKDIEELRERLQKFDDNKN